MNIFNKYSSRKPCYASIVGKQIPTRAAQYAMQNTGNGLNLTLKGDLSNFLGADTDDTELSYMMTKFLNWVYSQFIIEKNSNNY